METTNLSQVVIAFAAGAFVTYLYMRKYMTSSETNYTTPTMNPQTIKNMVDNYRNNQLAVINENLNMEDAYSVNFNLDAVKNFASSIENESKKINSELTDKDLGIRFYYAAYPQSENMGSFSNEGISTEYNMKHTVVMIPTIKRRSENGQTEDYDFNPLDGDTYNRTTHFGNNVQKLMSSSSSSPEEVMALNHGGLIPPLDPIVQSF